MNLIWLSCLHGIMCMFRDDELGVETESSHESLGVLKPNIEELEMLLEAYFVQIDGTLNKLSHVCPFFPLIVKFCYMDTCFGNFYHQDQVIKLYNQPRKLS